MLNLLQRLKNRGRVTDRENGRAGDGVNSGASNRANAAAPPARTQLAFDFDAAVPEAKAANPAAPWALSSESDDAGDALPAVQGGVGGAGQERGTRPSRGRAAVRARTGVLFSRLESLGLRGVDALVLMRTRTVMVSLIGRTLRVHEGYADADEAVLRAIVAFATARTKVARNQARDVILAHDVERAPAPRRAEPAKPGDAALIAQLTVAHQELNARWFNGELHALPLRLSGRMATRLGHFDPGSKFTPPEIVMSRKHVVRHGWKEAMHTLLHEMVHQWQHQNGLPVDHGAGFRKKCREVGITPAARRDVTPMSHKRAHGAA